MIVNFVDMNWSPIFEAFGSTDIAQKKFLNQYNFNVYDDATTGNRGFIYTAKSPELYTQTLQIGVDPSNNKITSIYIEAGKDNFFGSVRKKLLYVPLRVIQLQESENTLLGKARNLRVDYRFLGQEVPDEPM